MKGKLLLKCSRKILLGILVLFVIAQFVRPDKNIQAQPAEPFEFYKETNTSQEVQLILKIHTTSNFLKVLQTMELKMENCLPADFGERVRNWRSNRGAIIRSVELPPPNLLIQLINVATVGYLRNDQSH